MELNKATIEVQVGALCRETMFSDPTQVAGAMLVWFGPDSGHVYRAVEWMREIADTLEEAGRGTE